jgi:hypothetical protein
MDVSFFYAEQLGSFRQLGNYAALRNDYVVVVVASGNGK